MKIPIKVPLSLTILLSPGLAQEKPAASETPKGRAIGGAVVLVHKAASPLTECVVSRDGKTLVMYTSDTTLHFKNVVDHLGGDKKKVGKRDSAFPYEVRSVQLSTDGSRLFGVIPRSTLAVLTPPKTPKGFPKILHHMRGLPGLRSYARHPQGTHLVAGMQGGLARIFDAKTSKPVNYLQAHDKDVTWVGFTPDGKSLITAFVDKRVRFFTFPAGVKQTEFELPNAIRGAAIDPQGVLLAGYFDKSVQLINLKTLTPGDSFDAGGTVQRVAFSGDGKSLAIALADGTIALYETKKFKKKHAFKAHAGGEIICLGFVEPTKGRRLLVTAAQNEDVVFWDLATLTRPKTKKGKKRRRE